MKSKTYQLKYITTILIMLIVTLSSSCKKYLDEKPVKNLVVPKNLDDLQALLDNQSIMNERTPILSVLASDDYYLPSDIWQSRVIEDRINYLWDPTATYLNSWKAVYQGPVYYANVILDALPEIEAKGENGNAIKGSALFFRGFNFHLLAQLYCRPYSSSAATDQGLPARTTAAIEEPSTRVSVQATYDQIISDLTKAAELLPETTTFPTRPNKASAFGALARTYLAIGDYINAKKSSDSFLARKNVLIDYNSLLPVGNPPIKRFNAETIFYNHAFGTSSLSNTRARIDSNLYASYAVDDLRKTIFFQANTGTGAGTYGFRGSYDGEYLIYSTFDGIATDEVYLIRAECNARLGDKNAALDDLNKLLVKRWKTGTFTSVTATDADDAKNKILLERRKELVFRGLRWSDVRRLNQEGANITMKRIINGDTYTLSPNDLRYVMLIPQEVINLSGMPQNPR
jgi:starch-binding outer membrane protein, SusD/RagB family